MNKSGEALGQFIKDNKQITFTPENLTVIHDDLDMIHAKIKLKYNSGAGGHKGVISVINTLQCKNFFRIKIGIGKPDRGNVADYVLGKFKNEEKEIISSSIKKAAYLSILLGFFKDISKVSGFIKIL
jgi:PTH1 family peptidyl-tRNA hydrolase